LDLCAGEIARVKLNEAGVVHLTLYGVREGRERDAKELAQGGRLVSLLDNPHVSPLPSPSKDELKQDILDTPGMVADVRKTFQDETSENSRTAQALLRALLTRTAPRVLVLGITSELWLAEQFVHNLAALFPRLAARAVSSNAVLLATAPWDVDENTIVLAVSQTGQDFPTLGALVALMSQRPQALDAFFVLTGQVDTLMGQAVGQSFARGAPFSERILVNQTGGFRPSEAQFSTLSATHATLSELVLWLARRGLDPGDLPALSRKKSLETRLTRDDLEALEARRDASILSNIPSLVTAQGGRVFGGTSNEGAALVRRFRWHVLEGLVAFAGAVGILELNLRGHAQLLPSALLSRVLGSACAPSNLCGEIIGQLDVLFYAFLAPLFVWLLRAVQGRPLLHRQGPRELLIGDTETNHKILWLFARKLFGLSYGFASIKPYSANHQDELIMTHEPVRGCLVLLGLIDLRHEHLKTQSHAAFMTAKQLINSRSVAGSGAEIVTVGHAAPPGFDARFHVTLPNAHHLLKGELAERLCEGLYDSWERLIGMQLFLEQLARGVARLPWYDRFKTKDRVYAPTTASPVSAAAVYQALSRTQERYVGDQLDDLPFEVAPSSWRGSGVKRTTTFWREETGE